MKPFVYFKINKIACLFKNYKMFHAFIIEIRNKQIDLSIENIEKVLFFYDLKKKLFIFKKIISNLFLKISHVLEFPAFSREKILSV